MNCLSHQIPLSYISNSEPRSNSKCMTFPTAILLVSIRIFKFFPNVSRIESRCLQGDVASLRRKSMPVRYFPFDTVNSGLFFLNGANGKYVGCNSSCFVIELCTCWEVQQIPIQALSRISTSEIPFKLQTYDIPFFLFLSEYSGSFLKWLTYIEARGAFEKWFFFATEKWVQVHYHYAVSLSMN